MLTGGIEGGVKLGTGTEVGIKMEKEADTLRP
jgi:hypothetical protein